ncbi:replication factor A protein 3 [Epithele typhae]|uniref:replication factor A protein 3 n=1 Tax=Epithele typhae TaxID=378194 RepID=UPI002007F425|nr:replication factor A protein 3 [Epithele typhae]KAH9923936.1 replication factor A protein 3 [Epithele typhae]
MTDHRSPRVNKALLAKYIGQTVRLVGKVISANGDTAIVQASDEGQVEVQLLNAYEHQSTYIEVIGTVRDERTIKMVAYVDMGDDVDMKLADRVVQVWHDPKFSKVF